MDNIKHFATWWTLDSSWKPENDTAAPNWVTIIPNYVNKMSSYLGRGFLRVDQVQELANVVDVASLEDPDNIPQFRKLFERINQEQEAIYSQVIGRHNQNYSPDYVRKNKVPIIAELTAILDSLRMFKGIKIQ